jgi:hypothetical protein
METAIFIFIHILIHVAFSAFLITVISDYEFRSKLGLKSKRVRNILLWASIIPAVNVLVIFLIFAFGMRALIREALQKFKDALNEED